MPPRPAANAPVADEFLPLKPIFEKARKLARGSSPTGRCLVGLVPPLAGPLPGARGGIGRSLIFFFRDVMRNPEISQFRRSKPQAQPRARGGRRLQRCAAPCPRPCPNLAVASSSPPQYNGFGAKKDLANMDGRTFSKMCKDAGILKAPLGMNDPGEQRGEGRRRRLRRRPSSSPLSLPI